MLHKQIEVHRHGLDMGAHTQSLQSNQSNLVTTGKHAEDAVLAARCHDTNASNAQKVNSHSEYMDNKGDQEEIDSTYKLQT